MTFQLDLLLNFATALLVVASPQSRTPIEDADLKGLQAATAQQAAFAAEDCVEATASRPVSEKPLLASGWTVRSEKTARVSEWSVSSRLYSNDRNPSLLALVRPVWNDGCMAIVRMNAGGAEELRQELALRGAKISMLGKTPLLRWRDRLVTLSDEPVDDVAAIGTSGPTIVRVMVMSLPEGKR